MGEDDSTNEGAIQQAYSNISAHSRNGVEERRLTPVLELLIALNQDLDSITFGETVPSTTKYLQQS
jgi:hypothetical protein